MKIEIRKGGSVYDVMYYHIYLDDKDYRTCEGYKELAMCVAGLIKSAFKEEKDVYY